MSKDHNTYPESQSDEMDSRDFFQFSKEAALELINAMSYVLKLSLKYWYFFLVTFSLVAGIQYVKYKNSKELFSATAQLGHNELVKKTYGEMILRLQELIDNESYETLSDLLQFPVEQASSIVEISATNLAGSALHEDIAVNNLPFYIHLKTLDRESISLLEGGVQYYLENHSKSRELGKINRRIMEEKYSFYESELKKLDSLIVAIKSSVNEGNWDEEWEINLADLFIIREELNEKRMEYSFALEHYRPVEYVYGFIAPENPTKNFDFKKSILSIVMTLLASLAFSFFIELIRKDASD